MPRVIKSASFDAADALALARFWAAVLGSDVDEDSTADKAFVEAPGWGGRTCGSPGFLSPRRRATAASVGGYTDSSGHVQAFVVGEK